MSIKSKPPKFEHDENNPFENDKLERVYSAELLTNLINSFDENAVIAIDSKWGTGKSTFITMWSKMLKLQEYGYKTIVLNAWENDYCDDVMPFLISEIGIGIDEYRDDKTKQVTLNGLKEAGTYLFKSSFNNAIKFASNGVIDPQQKYENLVDQLTTKFSTEEVNNYIKAKKQLVNFKITLNKSIKTISKDKPLILFIDELDRCRPLFAIEILEKVKHFFNVENIVFVIAVDKEQLCHSIGSVYGSGIDTDGYLKRFFDIEYKFPEANIDNYIDYLVEKFNFKRFFNDDADSVYGISSVFKDVCDIFDLDMRTIEQCFTQLSIAIRIGDLSNRFIPYIVFLILLKSYDKLLFNDYFKNKNSSVVIKRLKGIDKNNYFVDSQLGVNILSQVISGVMTEAELDQYSDRVMKNHSTTPAVFTEAGKKRLVNILPQLFNFGGYNHANECVNKINMVGEFVVE